MGSEEEGSVSAGDGETSTLIAPGLQEAEEVVGAAKMPGFFVTATDTEVGKTVVAAGLAMVLRERGHDVGVMKPVASGAVDGPNGAFSEDARFLMQAAQVNDPIELVNPVCLRAPLAPTIAAAQEGRRLHLEEILEAFAKLRAIHETLIVEGVGGLVVPVAHETDVADMAGEMGLPLIIVARPGLGTINHTLLTIEAALHRKLRIAGIVISRYPAEPGIAERTNPEVIESESGFPVLGLLPEDPSISVEENRLGRLGELFRAHVAVPYA